VIDAAGAIYVIGGYGGGTHYHDAWVSTDGGAAGLGGKLGVLDGYSNGTQGGTRLMGFSGFGWGGLVRALACLCVFVSICVRLM